MLNTGKRAQKADLSVFRQQRNPTFKRIYITQQIYNTHIFRWTAY